MRKLEYHGATGIATVPGKGARLAAATGLAIAWMVAATASQAVTAGGEVRYSAGGDHPAVALRGADKVVAAWSQNGDIRARRFKLDQIEGGVFLANTTSTGDLSDSQVGMDRNGNFVIVWQGGSPATMHPAGGDGSGTGIFAQRFRSNGTRRDGNFRVNDLTADDQTHPRLGIAPNGAFAVLWEDRLKDASGAVVNGLRVGAWGANGARLGRPTTLAAGGAANLVGGVGAWDDGYAAGWTEVTPCEGSHEDVTSAVASFGWGSGQRGVAHVSDSQGCDDEGPALLALPGSQYGPLGIYVGRRYTIQRYSSATGEALTERPTIAELPSCDTTSCERIAALAGDGRGRFVVIWESQTPRTDDGTNHQLLAQLYGKDGRERSEKFIVTASPSDAAQNPAAALTANGTLVVTWKRTTGDAATSGLFLRAFRLP